MKTKTILIALAAAATASGAGAAMAQPATARVAYQDGAGRTWTSVPSETGVVLATRGSTIHLGRDCKAASSRLGIGRWQSAGSGFAVMFGDQRIEFTGTLDLGQPANCRG